jgi:hypothetical protein
MLVIIFMLDFKFYWWFRMDDNYRQQPLWIKEALEDIHWLLVMEVKYDWN